MMHCHYGITRFGENRTKLYKKRILYPVVKVVKCYGFWDVSLLKDVGELRFFNYLMMKEY